MDTTLNYMQIAEALREEIRSGAYVDSDSFPSLTKIMRRFGVSRPSAVRSVAELKRLGLVAAKKGSGTFVSKQNRIIGLVIPGTADSEFFSAIMDGLVCNCNQCGMDLVAGDVFSVNHELRNRQAERLARHLVSLPAAGVIMQPVAFHEDAERVNGVIADILGEAGIPVVLIDYDIVQPPDRSRYDLVAIDNFSAGRRVAAHLIEVGAKRICCLLCGLSAESVHVRFAGVEAEYQANAPEETILHLRTAYALGLAVTAGSDFHGANKPTITLGMTVADEEAFLAPFWEALAAVRR